MRVDFYSNEQGIETMLRLVRIAMKAHGNNSSPVDIKLELAELDSDILMQMEDDLNRVKGGITEIKTNEPG